MVRFTWRGALVGVCHDRVIFSGLTQGHYTHCKARHRKKLLDRGYEIHAVAGDRLDALGRAEIILHVDDKKSWFESHVGEMVADESRFAMRKGRCWIQDEDFRRGCSGTYTCLPRASPQILV